MKNESLLFITGGPKTGTSTILGMLNCHPDIFLLYECFLNKTPSKYAGKFLREYPDARRIFRYGAPLDKIYPQLRTFLLEKGHDYKIVGDKIPSLDPRTLDELNGHKVIFTVRNIRTWLCKNAIVDWYYTDNDIVYPAISYSVYFLKSFFLPNCKHIRMEDMIRNNEKIIKELGEFLGLETIPHLSSWWKKTEDPDKNSPKNALGFKTRHDSTLIVPGKEDTRAKLSKHPFWDVLLPIFDKYFEKPDGYFTPQEINRDIETLKSLERFSPLGLSKMYENYASVTLELPKGKRSYASCIPWLSKFFKFRK